MRACCVSFVCVPRAALPQKVSPTHCMMQATQPSPGEAAWSQPARYSPRQMSICVRFLTTITAAFLFIHCHLHVTLPRDASKMAMPLSSPQRTPPPPTLMP